MPTQSEKINKLDKEVAIIKKRYRDNQNKSSRSSRQKIIKCPESVMDCWYSCFFKSNYSAQRYTFIILSIYLSDYGQETP